MAMTTKKRAQKSAAKPRFPAAKKAQAKQTQTVQALRGERDEALEQLAAASDILRMIARSPTDLQPVLDAIAESAAKLCDATDAVVWRADGDMFRPASHFGPISTRVGRGQEVTRGTAVGRAFLDRQTIHIEDLAEAAKTEFPGSEPFQKRTGTRTFLCTPMLREEVPIGLIAIRRTEVRPFTERQIKLLETFADQAVIAIENVRLFQELKEALERQTATGEILGVIASSPTEIQPVLDAVASNAARLCEATDAQVRLVEDEGTRLVASFGSTPAPDLLPTSLANPAGKVILQRQTRPCRSGQNRISRT
jgi:GAF domain-containing protein